MPIIDVFRGQDLRKQLDACSAENAKLKDTIAQMGVMDAVRAKEAIDGLQTKRGEVQRQVWDLESELANKRKDLIEMDDSLLLQGFGLYRQRFGLENSDQYKTRIDAIHVQQAAMVRTNRATVHAIDWEIHGSKVAGAKMVKEYEKLILRAFNNECDAAIADVKHGNVQACEKRIVKAFDSLNALGGTMQIRVQLPYRDLRLDELYLVHEYRKKLEAEKEEMRARREQMREEAKVIKELEEARAKLGKEETHFNQALDRIRSQLANAPAGAARQLMELEKAKIEANLAQVGAKLLDVEKREANTRAGYVYVISNIGSFGENVVKIGVTRRLDPQERIDELGDASVPFRFDVHALVFSDDAPTLENALHKAFATRKLNFVNHRREFYRAPLAEIEQVLMANFQKPAEFVHVPEAPEYRESLAIAAQQALVAAVAK